MADTEMARIVAAIRDQWVSMTGMAAMFVLSIGIGIFIQPFYNFDNARAFGEEGTTQAGNVLLELGMILIFTVGIIWLARKGLAMVIKAIVFLALGYSLFISFGPPMAIVLYLAGSNSLNAWLALSMSFTIGMMVILHKFPEWYVVNSVGVLVGSGVITMIGIAFVPVLVIFFMILAAVYDHWAVNKSKHMLELADTMIDLKLPVLLVAPKSSNYSFIDQESNVMRRGEDVGMSWEGPLNGEVVPKSQAKGRDALFMGLGDVIFPGILVISSITFLPDIGPVVFDFWGDPSEPVHLGPMLVGLGTLAGGLVGYMALMTQVARGRPQAGLPLLNGGSILGYIISGTIALGFSNLWQDITFL